MNQKKQPKNQKPWKGFPPFNLKFGVKEGYFFGERDSWAIFQVGKFIKEKKSVTVCQIYDINVLRQLKAGDEFIRALVKMSILALYLAKKVNIRYRRGYKIISWKKAKPLKVRPKN